MIIDIQDIITSPMGGINSGDECSRAKENSLLQMSREGLGDPRNRTPFFLFIPADYAENSSRCDFYVLQKAYAPPL